MRQKTGWWKIGTGYNIWKVYSDNELSLNHRGLVHLYIFFMFFLVLCLGLGNCCLVNHIDYFTKISFKAEECSTVWDALC